MFACLLSACKDDNNSANGSANSPLAIQLDSFPLAVGHSWKFYTEIHVTDSVGASILHSYYDNYWTVIADTVINSVASAKVMQLDSNYDGSIHLGYSYYANKPDGFYGMAQENSGSMFFLLHEPPSAYYINPGTRTIDFTTTIDTLFVPDTALCFMKFPIVINDSWHTVHYGSSGNYYQSRKYNSFQTVTTNAGTFNCVKLQVYYEDNGQPDTTLSIFQYYSRKGLIKETRFAHLTFGDGSHATLNQITELVQVNF